MNAIRLFVLSIAAGGILILFVALASAIWLGIWGKKEEEE